MCNINVRTIQRIEAGEVTPRSYTLKTILKVLDCDLEEIHLEEKNKLNFSRADLKTINICAWLGIVFIIIDSFNIFLNITLDFDLDVLESITSIKQLYITTQFVSFILAFTFYLGFYISGKIFKSSLLKATSILMIVVSGLNYFFSGFLFDSNEFIKTTFGVVTLLGYGAVGIPFGIGILKLNTYLSSYATSGIFTIILYATMLTVVLIFMSVFLIVPVMILQLILLYKVKEYLQHT